MGPVTSRFASFVEPVLGDESAGHDDAAAEARGRRAVPGRHVDRAAEGDERVARGEASALKAVFNSAPAHSERTTRVQTKWPDI